MSLAAASEASVCYTLPDVTAPSGDMNDTWAAISTVLEPRWYHSAIWTGSEMIIWGGYNLASHSLNNGASYNPATDSWTLTSVTNAPEPRSGANAVWTGSQMIVWGGAGDHGQLNSGGKYNPATDSWTATATTNAPEPRTQHTAIWTGNEVIVWGGFGCGGNCNFNSGGRYNPDTDSWTATSVINAPSRRFEHTAVWTGNEMIIWSGTDAIPNATYLRTGGRYNPATDSWMPTSLANVPLGRVAHTAIWTGNQMVVWGGVDETFHDVNTGGRYNPGADSWVATSLANAPTARDTHTAVWTGSEMIIWGGDGSSGYLNTGGRYIPGTNSWTTTTTLNAPMARAYHTAVWIGSEMIVWGGLNSGGFFLNTGGSYHAEPSTPTVQSAVSRKSHGDAGSFDVNLPLSGPSGIECRSGGATGDYRIVVTFAANVSMNANPQAAVTSGVGTIGSGGVGNGGMVMTSGNVVTIPLTNVANAQTISVTLNSVNGSDNVTIPMRVLIGDVTGNGTVNATDVSQTKSCVGQAVNATDFLCDVNASGAINATDVSLVKSESGTALP